MQEVWKDIKGYEGKYQVSNLGNVKSLNYRRYGYEKVLTPKKNNRGYLWCVLRKDNSSNCHLIHRLVASAFLDNENNLPEINHKDENPLNNCVDNLEWCTHAENMIYSAKRHPERYENMNRNYVRAKRKKYKRRPGEIRKGKNFYVKINQFSIDGEFVRQWDNQRQVYREMGYFPSSIKNCCLGKRKTAHGYKWEFAK